VDRLQPQKFCISRMASTGALAERSGTFDDLALPPPKTSTKSSNRHDDAAVRFVSIEMTCSHKTGSFLDLPPYYMGRDRKVGFKPICRSRKRISRAIKASFLGLPLTAEGLGLVSMHSKFEFEEDVLRRTEVWFLTETELPHNVLR